MKHPWLPAVLSFAASVVAVVVLFITLRPQHGPTETTCVSFPTESASEGPMFAVLHELIENAEQVSHSTSSGIAPGDKLDLWLIVYDSATDPAEEEIRTCVRNSEHVQAILGLLDLDNGLSHAFRISGGCVLERFVTSGNATGMSRAQWIRGTYQVYFDRQVDGSLELHIDRRLRDGKP